MERSLKNTAKTDLGCLLAHNITTSENLYCFQWVSRTSCYIFSEMFVFHRDT